MFKIKKCKYLFYSEFFKDGTKSFFSRSFFVSYYLRYPKYFLLNSVGSLDLLHNVFPLSNLAQISIVTKWENHAKKDIYA